MVITGASTGLGEQLAYHYARLGANIVITSNEQRLAQVQPSYTFARFYFFFETVRLSSEEIKLFLKGY